MSHAVLSGAATPAQRYVDKVVREAGGEHNVAKILYHCLKIHPEDVMVLNGHLGQSFTKSWVLARSVRVARALRARVQGRAAITVAANHEHLVAASLGCLLAGVVPLGLDPNVTIFELDHFFNIWPPSVVFCDVANRENVEQAAGKMAERPTVVVLTGDGDGSLDAFVEGQSDGLEDFQVADASPSSTAVLLPTSGSTGPAKAALISHEGLVAQMYCLWMHYTTFPRPVERALLLSSAQWMTWWDMFTSTPVFRITLVMTPKVTAETTLQIIKKHQVTWALMSPAIACRVRSIITPPEVTSLRNWLITGAPISVDTIAALQKNLQEGAFVRQGYGMTELHGFFSIPDKETPLNSVGFPANIFQYKIIDDNGKELGPNEKGDLLIKSDLCVIKGYYKNEKATRESISPDGWLQTGDSFYRDDAGRIFFVERKKFWFKCDNYQIIDDNGKELGPNEKGDLLIKSDLCVIKGYYKNEKATRESISPDGWLQTGDSFYRDDAGRIFFVERKKFWFKCDNYQVSPEEVEAVISAVPGVELCVVCGAGEGAAALVVKAPGSLVTRPQIHEAVDSTLSSYKRLHGGIAFVSSLPLTHSGKLNRRNCHLLMMQLIQEKLCFK